MRSDSVEVCAIRSAAPSRGETLQFAREVELIRCHLAPLRNRRSLTASFGREAFQSLEPERPMPLSARARSAPPTPSAGWSSASGAQPAGLDQPAADGAGLTRLRAPQADLWSIRSTTSAASSAASIVSSSARVQVAPLDHLERMPGLAEEPADRGPREAVRLVLEVVDGLQVRVQALEPVEPAQDRHQLDGLLGDDRRQPSRLSGRHASRRRSPGSRRWPGSRRARRPAGRSARGCPRGRTGVTKASSSRRLISRSISSP